MSVSIDSVTFTHPPIWEDKAATEDLRTVVYEAIDRTAIIREGAPPAEYPITLVGKDKTGWVKGSEITSLKALAAVAKATYTLVYDTTTVTVRFKNEQRGGAIQMGYLNDDSTPGDDTWYIGKIYLMAVT